jgi:hypothetical protein
MRDNQIIVQSKDGSFGEGGDSGAVAYLISDNGKYPAGTAIGQYWRTDGQDLHALAPLTDVLGEIQSKTGLKLRLL